MDTVAAVLAVVAVACDSGDGTSPTPTPSDTPSATQATVTPVPAVFDWVQTLGNIELEEMFRVFNMGFGLVLVVRSESAGAVGELLKDERTVVIGEVVSVEV